MEVCENTSIDTSVTRTYGISDKEEEIGDDIISIPDASILRRQIQDLCQEGEDKGCSEGANEPILESISQQFLVKEEVGSPLKNSKLAGIINNLFIEKLDEEKLEKLVKTYNKPENCPNMITPKCNEEIWRGDILNTSRRSNDIVLQKIQMHTVKAASAMADACDKIMEKNLKSDQCREMITPVIDALALLGVVTAEINQFRREQMEDQCPVKMQPLTKKVPPESEWLFGNDLSKRIDQLNSTNTALIKTFISSYSGKNTRYLSKQSTSSRPSTSATNTPKNLQSFRRCSAQGKRWIKQHSNKFARN